MEVPPPLWLPSFEAGVTIFTNIDMVKSSISYFDKNDNEHNTRHFLSRTDFSDHTSWRHECQC